jgi:hypothetical protein
MPRRRTVTENVIHAPHWEAHETVLIRSLRERDNEAIQDKLAAMTAGADTDMKLALGTTRRLTMFHGIVSWTLTDEHGRPLPISMESIMDLFPEDADFIYGAINDMNQPMTEQEKKPSSTPADHGAQANTAEYPRLLSSGQ